MNPLTRHTLHALTALSLVILLAGCAAPMKGRMQGRKITSGEMVAQVVTNNPKECCDRVSDSPNSIISIGFVPNNDYIRNVVVNIERGKDHPYARFEVRSPDGKQYNIRGIAVIRDGNNATQYSFNATYFGGTSYGWVGADSPSWRPFAHYVDTFAIPSGTFDYTQPCSCTFTYEVWEP